MSFLTVYADDRSQSPVLQTGDVSLMAAELREVGVAFEQWSACEAVDAESTSAEILAAYAPDIQRLKSLGGYQTADVINMVPSHPDKQALRDKFLSEHRHSEDEVRFFVRGTGVFYLHLSGRVYAVQCTRGDLISVPANTPHWFDMGDAPSFTCIRLFTNPEGWVAQYTGSPIAAEFPRFESLVRSDAA